MNDWTGQEKIGHAYGLMVDNASRPWKPLGGKHVKASNENQFCGGDRA